MKKRRAFWKYPIVAPGMMAAAVVLFSAMSGNPIIATVAGNGTADYGGDGLAATLTSLNDPYSVAIDTSGNLYIADYHNNRIRKVSTFGVITTVAGNGMVGFSGDGGAALSAQLYLPCGVALDASGNLYIADTGNNRIRKVSPAGIITTVAGNGTQGFSGTGSSAVSAQLSNPFAVTLDKAGNLYIADAGNNRVCKVSPAGVITTVAGNRTPGFSGDGGPGAVAEVNYPCGMAVDASGNLYFADNNNSRVRKIGASGIITTVAGNGTGGYGGDGGAAVSAQIWGPVGLALDSSGNLFISDALNHCVRKVDTSGIITTVSGTGTGGYGGDGGPAASAQLFGPYGIALDSQGNLYIADVGNQRIRKVH